MGLGVLLVGTAAAAQLAALAVPSAYRDLLSSYPAVGRVTPELLRAIAWQESDNNAGAVSPVNANGTRDYGLMQINQVNLPALGLNTVTALDPVRNSAGAYRLLVELDKRAGGVGDLLSMYNAGEAPGGGPRKTAGGQYVDQTYVRDAWARYALLNLARLGLVKVGT